VTDPQPIISQEAAYTLSPLVKLDPMRIWPGSIVLLNEPGHVELVREAREWYEPIEDEE
jgi:hypothetical protein